MNCRQKSLTQSFFGYELTNISIFTTYFISSDTHFYRGYLLLFSLRLLSTVQLFGFNNNARFSLLLSAMLLALPTTGRRLCAVAGDTNIDAG